MYEIKKFSIIKIKAVCCSDFVDPKLSTVGTAFNDFLKRNIASFTQAKAHLGKLCHFRIQGILVKNFDWNLLPGK